MSDNTFYAEPIPKTDQSCSADPKAPKTNAGVDRGGSKRPYVPPVIETLYATAGLPPDVILEWSGGYFQRAEMEDD